MNLAAHTNYVVLTRHTNETTTNGLIDPTAANSPFFDVLCVGDEVMPDEYKSGDVVWVDPSQLVSIHVGDVDYFAVDFVNIIATVEGLHDSTNLPE